MVKKDTITMSTLCRIVIYRMQRDLYGKITRAAGVINTSMKLWQELLINSMYLAAVVALVYIFTSTDIVSHLLAY